MSINLNNRRCIIDVSEFNDHDTVTNTQYAQSLMSRFNVQGFPTILVFGADKSNPLPYDGARTASAIESFALEQLETNVSPPEVSELTGTVSILVQKFPCIKTQLAMNVA